MSLVQEVLQGRRLSLARLLTHIENDTNEGREALDQLFRYAGKAHLLGVTGAPGTGKSSLVNQLALAFRNPTGRQTKKVGIVAVDPTSPFSGGAILGDRVRMRDLAGDSGVFIRSMASRGSLGGLAAATSGVVQALDAAGYEIILIETVGAGQAEVEIAHLAHTTLVVEAPGLGDEIQAIKAGILEIADLLVINKADRPGVEMTENALRSMLQLAHPPQHLIHVSTPKLGHPGDSPVFTTDGANRPNAVLDQFSWSPPILKTVATEGKGIGELLDYIDRHYLFLSKTGELEHRNRIRLQAELDLLLHETLIRRWEADLPKAEYLAVLESLFRRDLSPRQAVGHLIGDMTGKR